MTKNVHIERHQLVEDFKRMGVEKGDVVLVRGALGKVGRLEKKGYGFIEALRDVVGKEGTIISLSFTHGARYILKPNPLDAFFPEKPSYAGALPNTMLKHPNAYRSSHPMCSFVAIGKYAEYLTAGHDENAFAYEPVRKVMALNGKCLLVGCVKESPGFTTTHVAESDLNLGRLLIFQGMCRIYYKKWSGETCLFTRTDLGFCSNSYYKFYSKYIENEILRTGFIGNAYSILGLANDTYQVEKQALKKNKNINICNDKYCFTCNAGRWDRVYRAPFYVIRRIYRKIFYVN